ncbi:MAG: double zinc ribbon domain-containing protein, partial [Spirillospora sp.]
MTGDQHAAKAAELSCPACGEIVYAGEVFCEECGHRLTDAPPATAEADADGRPDATIRQSSSSPSSRRRASTGPCTGCAGTAIDADGYCESCGLRQPAERDHIEFEIPGDAGGNGTRPVIAAGASDRGRRYSRNEDAIAIAVHAAGVAAVVSD